MASNRFPFPPFLTFLALKKGLKTLTSTSICCNMSSMATKGKQRITLFLDPDRVKYAKVQAVEEEISLSELFEKALDRYPWYKYIAKELEKARSQEGKK